MIVPAFLFLMSLAGIGVALTMPGLSDFVLVAAPCALASAFLLLRAGLPPIATGRRRKTPSRERPKRESESRHRAWRNRVFTRKYIIIDGSNVMHWKEGAPQIDTVRDVVQHLKSHGFSPGVVFDANAGHILTGKYQHHGAMGKLLGLSEDRIMVVHKGTPADVTILAAAKDLGARIVTNDRYRDWADTHPEIGEPGHLIKGGYREGQLWLDLA